VDDQLTIELIKAGDRTDFNAIGEFAPLTFVGNDVSHNSLFLIQPDSAVVQDTMFAPEPTVKRERRQIF